MPSLSENYTSKNNYNYVVLIWQNYKDTENYTSRVQEIIAVARDIEGFLTEREMRFLALLGACPTAEGRILEIGSFKGRSSVILSKSAGLAGDPRISAVDPLTSPSETDPDLKGQESGWDDFQDNLKRAGVIDHVDFHRTTSDELAKTWRRPLRLLWIDGDHTYAGTKSDFTKFVPHLSDHGIIAMHDVIHEFDGGIRVFSEDILLSDHFGPCGLVGTIGWAQYFSNPAETRPYRRLKLDLYRRTSKLIPYVAFGQKSSGLKKLLFKIHRARIPHKAIDPNSWLAMLG